MTEAERQRSDDRDATDAPDAPVELTPPIGLIAAGGGLPLAAVRGIHAARRRVVCVGLRGQFHPELPATCDMFLQAGLIQLGRWIRLLKKHGCREALMLGKVHKERMYDPFRWFRYVPDLRAGKLWFGILRHDKRPDSMLGAIAGEFALDGITMIDSTRYIPELMAHEGVMTKTKPTGAQLADIEFALPIIHRLGDLDIGQSIAVSDRDVIAVEAIEGTDSMIERAGVLCKRGKWTLVKIAKPGQDMRFDVPTVGPQTILNMQRNGGTCLAVEAGKTILLDKPQFLELADRAGIAVVGLSVMDAMAGK